MFRTTNQMYVLYIYIYYIYMPQLACDFEKTDMNVNAPTQTKPSLLICKEEHMYQNTGAKIGNNIPMNNWWIEGLSFAIHAKTA